MKAVPVLVTLLIAQFGSVVGAPLESYTDENWDHSNYTNDSYGLTITIVERPAAQRRGDNWGSGKYRIDREGEDRIAIGVLESDPRTQTGRVPLTKRVIGHLIADSSEPQYLRFLAVSNLVESELAPDTIAVLLASAIVVPSGWLRYYAWAEAFEYAATGHDFAGLEQVLFDPCLDIAHDHLTEVIARNSLRGADGHLIHVTLSWRGALIDHYHCQHQETLAVAEALKGVHPELVSDQTLASLRARRVPPYEWLTHYFGKNADRMLRYYKEEFHE